MATVKSCAEIIAQMKGITSADRALVEKAYAFAQDAHKDQKRYSGEPYFLHLSVVAYSLAEMGMDAQTVTAGILHDSIEDVGVTAETMSKEFGDEVLCLVEGVTKLGALRYHGLERHVESLRKLFAATAQDIRVLIIKLMDRLHNAQTLEHVPVEKQHRIAMETLEIYAPIADRLGMSVVKTELEDAVFPYVFPEEYTRMRDIMTERHDESERRLEKTERTLKKEMAVAGIRDFTTESRIKGLYSLYRKLERKKWDVSQIHDVLALRIIVPSVAECYTTLGVVHKHWRPYPGKIKDYIAFPKPNGYQSLHTTIYTGDGGTLEIQIRTEAMHREAQYGIASHIGYKEKSGYHQGNVGAGMEWIRQFLPGARPSTVAVLPGGTTDSIPQWVKELADVEAGDDSEDYLEDIKTDFFTHRLFVFTPKGDVIDLPLSATPIDFAYAIHSDVGDHVSGAKVNGKMASLDTELRNGDIVEIVTRHTAKPSKKWLDMARTNAARKHIRAALGENE